MKKLIKLLFLLFILSSCSDDNVITPKNVKVEVTTNIFKNAVPKMGITPTYSYVTLDSTCRTFENVKTKYKDSTWIEAKEISPELCQIIFVFSTHTFKELE